MRKTTIACGPLHLAAKLAGDAGLPALVLLHGWPQSSRIYDGVLDELARDRFVLAFDLPEVGGSRGAPASAEKTVLADIVLGAAEQCGARSIVVAGIDVGGMIAFAAARDHAARVRAAAVINTVLPGIEPWDRLLADPRVWHFAFHAIPDLPELLVAGHQRAYFDYFVDVLVGNKCAVPDALRDELARAYARPQALKAGFDWYRAMARDAEHNRSRKEMRTPLLYLRGDADGRSPDDYVAGLRKAGALEVTGGVLRHSGELAPLEAPEAFVNAMRAFAPSSAGD
jgi:pimeloyl-ACP methyl ester carboxylesterase